MTSPTPAGQTAPNADEHPPGADAFRYAPQLPRHIPSLNGLRAISILLVLIAHAAGTSGAPAFLDKLTPVGNFGVKVFFVISGFLITALLLREHAAGGIHLPGFYLRRTLRIFPAFYFYVAVVLVAAAYGLARVSGTDVVHAVTFTANYHAATFTPSPRPEWAWEFNHLWSLAVEEQFYLIWPCVLAVAGPRRAVWLAVAVLMLCPACRAVMWFGLDATPTAMTRRFQAVADALATGCLLALGYDTIGRVRRSVGWLGSGFVVLPVAAGGIALALALSAVDKGWYYVAGQSVANLSIALVIDHYVRHPRTLGGWILNSRPVSALGVLSYSLYLWQEPFLNPMAEADTRWTSFPLNLLYAFAAALASYFLIERPFLKWKLRFQKTSGSSL